MTYNDKQSTMPPVLDKILPILPFAPRKIRIAGLFAFLFVLVTACSQIQPGQTDEKNAQKRSITTVPTQHYTGPYSKIAEIDSGQGPTLTWKRVHLAGIGQRDYRNNRLIFDGQRFFVLADNLSYVSSNGESWKEIGLRLPWYETSEYSIAAYNGLVVMATSLPEIITWSIETNTYHRFTPSIALEGTAELRNTVTAGPKGILVTYFVWRSSTSGNVAAVYYSRNGQDWTQVDPDVFDKVQYPYIIAFKDGFLSLSNTDGFLISTDGLSWNDLSLDTKIGAGRMRHGLTPWGENILAFSTNVFTGPSVGYSPLMVINPEGKLQFPESGLSILEGSHIGLNLIDANQMGIVVAFAWDPHLPASGGCCSEGQTVGVVEFSTDGITWTRRQFPEQIYYVNGLAVGKDRVIILVENECCLEPVQALWVGLPGAQ